MTAFGPTRSSLVPHQSGSFLGYSGRGGNGVSATARGSFFGSAVQPEAASKH